MNRSLIISYIFSLLLTVSFSSHAQIYFTENKGQFDPHIKFAADIPDGKIYAERNGFTFVLFDTEHSKHQHSHDPKSPEEKGHVYKAVFKNCHDASIRGIGKYENYTTFYHTNRLKNTQVESFHIVKYENIYPNIDLKLYSNDYTLKYDFIVHPGGNPDDIQIEIIGADNVSLNTNGGINIETSVNTVYEAAPFAYQGRIQQKVDCKYRLNGNTFSFDLGKHNPTQAVIIDPELVFSTYSGSISDNWGFTAAYDHKGNVYSVGVVDGFRFIESPGAFQTEFKGGYATSGKPWDISIIKYNPEGTDRLWAAYLGGSGDEFPSSIICNSNNELIILGATGSADFPTKNAYQSEFKGGTNVSYSTFDFPEGTDLFITRISENGSRIISSTYLGGTANDGINFRPEQLPHERLGDDGMLYNYGDGSRGEVNVDEADNVLIASNTFSHDFPADNSFKGMQDGVIVKFNADISDIEWSEYIGGSSYDALYSVVSGYDGAIYTCGGTQSDNIATTAGAFQAEFSGETDGLIAQYTADGSQEAISYYGSTWYDQTFFVQTDTNLNVYTFGQTRARDQYFNTEDRYGQINSGQFISKFSANLDEREWSTTFGSGIGFPNIAPTAFQVNNCGRIYASGFGREFAETEQIVKEIEINRGYRIDTVETDVYFYDYDKLKGTKGMEVTSDAFRDETDGQDFYFIVLSPDALKLEYATFFGEMHDSSYYFLDPQTQKWYSTGGCLSSGEDHVDGGTSRFDKKGNIYQAICASCGGCQDFPVMPDEDSDPTAWSTTNNSTNCNNAVVRFYFDNTSMVADFYWEKDSCHNEIISFVNNTKLNGNSPTFKWNFGDGNSSDEESPEHTYLDDGTYRVVLTVTDSLSCNISDSIVRYLDISKENTIIELDSVNLCMVDTVQIGPIGEFSPSSVFSWTPADSINRTDIQNPQVWPSEDTYYYLTVNNGEGCIKNYRQKVKSDDELDFDFELIIEPENNNRCAGDEITITARSNADNLLFEWSNSPFFNFIFKSGTDSTYTFTAEENRHIYVKAEHSFCQSELIYRDTIIEVGEINMLIELDNNMVCVGGEANLHIEDISNIGSAEYSWNTTDGYIVNESADHRTIKTTNHKPATYIATAIASNGCSWTDSVRIEVDSLLLNSQVRHISCNGFSDGSINLMPDGIPPYNFEWSTGSVANYIIELSAGYYSISLTDDLGCENYAEFEIMEPEPISQNISQIQTNCDSACNGSISTSAIGGWQPYTIEYFADSDADSTISGDSLCTGMYYVVLTDSLGCTKKDSIQLTSGNNFPIIDVWAVDTLLYYSQSTYLHAESLGTADSLLQIEWSPEDFLSNTDGTITWSKPEYSIKYTVTVTDQWGCATKDSIWISVLDVICEDPYIFVPTALTPNDDGRNDYIQVKSQMIDKLHFVIYDRLGEKVFETNELEHKWDGSYKGQLLEPQVFVYYLEAHCIGEAIFKQKGNITLIR